ncbi:MAG: hypothetical protein KatS3mg014_0365 [Actinomycetota bacterium]|nr:MAG: hypothetical protein KatS3mg014_0365 [Actinomycetota bacterium]
MGARSAPRSPVPASATGQRSRWRSASGHTFSHVELFNHGGRPAVLDGVELVGGDGGLEIIGALAAERPALPGCNSAGAERFPPPCDWDMEPLEGFVIPPASAFQGRIVCVILGLRSTHPGVATSQGVAIHYHVGDRSYTYVDPYSLAFCTHDVPRRDCVAPDPVRSMP